MEEFILPLNKALTETFLPTLLDSAVNATERELFLLPILKGGRMCQYIRRKQVQIMKPPSS